MKLEGDQALLRVHLSNFLKHRGTPLYEVVVERARRERLAGATVLAGTLGYVGKGPILGSHPGALAVERPVIVEIVDRPEVLDSFLDGVAPLLRHLPVIVTLERARVARYGDEPGPGAVGGERSR